MLLPLNGRIVILDNEALQALPLMNVLSKGKIPYTYHSEAIEQLPDQPYDDIRVLFLDINLTKTVNNWEAVKSQLISTLVRIVPEGAPYILIVWSTNEKELFPKVQELFGKELKTIRPVMDLSVTKSDFFELDADNPENGYVLIEGTDVIGSLNQRLAERLKDIDAFEAVIKWENFVHLSGREVISDVFSLAAGTDDKNTSLKNIYYKLAEAMYGKKVSSDVSQIAARACIIFNDLLHDRLEYNINTLFKCEILKEIPRPETFDVSQKGIFNSKLLLSFDKSTEVLPGNVYTKTGEQIEAYPYNALLADAIDITRVAIDFYISKNEGSKPEPGQAIEYKNANKKEYQKFEKDLRDSIKSGSTFVDIESSPICDYAQNKWKANRLSPAILIPESYMWAVARAEYLYVSPSFSIGGNLSRILIDMRYFTSIPLATLTSAKPEPIFRLKHQFLIDIQASLSRHVSRPGISSIN